MPCMPLGPPCARPFPACVRHSGDFIEDDDGNYMDMGGEEEYWQGEQDGDERKRKDGVQGESCPPLPSCHPGLAALLVATCNVPAPVDLSQRSLPRAFLHGLAAAFMDVLGVLSFTATCA